jgi:uncharacterized glyoxalase superfamily protein PhnB
MKASPFLMIQGDAKDALVLWHKAFPQLEVPEMHEHAQGSQSGQIAAARIRFGGSERRLSEIPPVHAFTFTPSTSIFLIATTRNIYAA